MRPPGVSSSRQFLYIIVSISRERGNRLFRLGLTSNGLLVTLGKGLGLTLLAVLLPKQRNPSVKITFGALFFRYGYTNLPLGELQVHLATALRGSTGAFLEGPANCAGRHGEVAVVTIRKKHHPLAHWIDQENRVCREQGEQAYVKPAAFQKDMLTVGLEMREDSRIETGSRTVGGEAWESNCGFGASGSAVM